MPLDTQQMNSMYAQIVNGKVTKEESQFVTDKASGDAWDAIATDIAAIKSSNPDAVFEIVNEIP